MNKGKKRGLLPPVLAERGTQDPSDLQTMGDARSTRAVGVSQVALLGLEEGGNGHHDVGLPVGVL